MLFSEKQKLFAFFLRNISPRSFVSELLFTLVGDILNYLGDNLNYRGDSLKYLGDNFYNWLNIFFENVIKISNQRNPPANTYSLLVQ